MCISKAPFAAEHAPSSSDIFSQRPATSLLGFELAITGDLEGEHAHRTVFVFVLRETILSFLALSAQQACGITGCVSWSDLTTCAATLTSKFELECFSSNFVGSRCFLTTRQMTPGAAVVDTHDFFTEKMYKDRERLSRHWQSYVDLGPEPFLLNGGLREGKRIYAQSTQMEFNLSSGNALLRTGEDFLLLMYHDAANPALSM